MAARRVTAHAKQQAKRTEAKTKVAKAKSEAKTCLAKMDVVAVDKISPVRKRTRGQDAALEKALKDNFPTFTEVEFSMVVRNGFIFAGTSSSGQAEAEGR